MEKVKTSIISIAGFLGLLVWLFDATLDYFLFFEGSFLGLLVLDVPAHEFYFRVLIFICFIGFGMIASGIVFRMQKAQRELNEKEIDLRTTLNSIGDAVISTDVQGRIQRMNYKCEELTGWKQSEARDKELSEVFYIISAHSREVCANPVEKVLETGQIQGLANHTVLISRQGEEYHIADSASPIQDSRGVIIGVVLVFRDITQRYLQEQALKESERKLQTLMSNLPGMAYRCVNRYEWPMEFVSEGCVELTDYSVEEMISRDSIEYGELIHPEDAGRVWEQVNDSIAKGGPFWLEYRIISKHGREKWVWEKGRVVGKTPDGTEILEGFIADITERKQIEQESENLQNQLVHAQKMESVGRLAGGVAHDLNNMLVPILGYGDMLLADRELNQKHKHKLEVIYGASVRSMNLVKQLVAFSRRQQLNMENQDINNIVMDFYKLLQRTLREDIDIQFIHSDEQLIVQADRGQVEQVILNLVTNAQDAMPDGGAITIETKLVDLDENYTGRHLEVTPGRYAQLMVSDNGMGMDPETREHIFEPFYTTKDSGEGSGLGLATVYGVVKQHSGSMWVYSEPDQGTSFKIYFPVSDAPLVEEQSNVLQEPEHMGNRREMILVVEDEEIVRDLTVNVLQQQGYNVLYAGDASQCMQIVQEHEGPLDLLITDVIMPDMNGRDLFAQVEQYFPQIEVVYMSGYPEDAISSHGVLEDGVDFLPKPFSIKDLDNKVREVLDRKEVL